MKGGRPLRYDLGVVGHVVLDYISRGERVQGPTLGGPCTYSSLAARALDASVVVLSKVGSDFGRKRLSWLRSRGVAVQRIGIVKSSTTCFRISYQGNRRTMQVTSKCEPISKWDISKLPSSSAVHIGPVLDEVPPSLAMRLAERDSIVSLDPQGYLRRLTSDGTVRVKTWRDIRLLKTLEVLKVSENELAAIVGRRSLLEKLRKLGPKIVFLTKGATGTTLWARDEGAFSVPAYETRVQDPTGAGDALVGAFLVSWVKTGDLLWSAAVGSAVASFVVEKFGPARFGTRRQIERRAQTILDRTVKT